MPSSSKPPAIAVIAGAHGGLGRAFVRFLLASNFLVVGGVRRPSLNSGSRDLLYVSLDLVDPASVHTFCQYVRNTLPYIDILILNAATLSNNTNISHVIQTNALSHAYIAHELADLLHDRGRILAVSSGDGELVWFSNSLQSQLNHAASLVSFSAWLSYITAQYCAQHQNTSVVIHDHIHGHQKHYKLSKAILNSFVRAFSTKNSTPCFAVCPGDVDTPMLDTEINQGVDGVRHPVLSPDQAVLWMKDMLNPEVDARSFHTKFWRYGQPIPW